MTKDVNISQLATAVMWWLSYTNAVGRNYVLSEGAIKFPISEYLERSKTDSIELEYGHPKLSRKRFDLFFKKNGNEENVFEFKYIKNGSTRTQDEKQRVFNDLMRLFLFLETNHKAYFLICGNQVDFVSDFQRITSRSSFYIHPKKKGLGTPKIISEGFYTEWFSFDAKNPIKEINLNTTNAQYKTIYDIFFLEHNTPYSIKLGVDLIKPEKINTSLIFLSGNLEQGVELSQPVKIGIWEISK